jgi:hypothetical protein
MQRALMICLLAACGTPPPADAPDASEGPDAAPDAATIPPPMLLFDDLVVLWLDAAAPGAVIAPAGAVERWTDRSAHGHDALPPSLAKAPARATLAGMSAVTFDGADDQLLANALAPVGSRTVFLVGAGHDATIAPDHVGSLISTQRCPPTTGGITIGTLVRPANELRVSTVGQVSHFLQVNGSGDGDGGVIATDRWFVASLQMFPDHPGPSLSLGSYLDGCEPGHVSLGEVIVLDRGASHADLREIEHYLATKWAVPL